MPFNDPPWHPMNDPVDIKTVGKVLEELGELVSATARCLIQGINGLDPRNRRNCRRSSQYTINARTF